MNNFTYGYYLVQAMKELSPPTAWHHIVARALRNMNCNWRRKYNELQLRKALDVGLRFGIICEACDRYYLYEYGRVRSTGEISYDFKQNEFDPKDIQYDSDDEPLKFPMKRKCEDDGKLNFKKQKLN